MEIYDTYIIFLVDKQRFALRLSKVEKIVSMVEIIQIPKSPEFMLGAINFHGDFLPVIDLRKLFLLPISEVDINDKLIIVNTIESKVVLYAKSVEDIVESKKLKINDTDLIFIIIRLI